MTHVLATAIRRHALDVVTRERESHIGSAVSISDFLSVSYGNVMWFDLAPARACSSFDAVLEHGGQGGAIVAGGVGKLGTMCDGGIGSRMPDALKGRPRLRERFDVISLSPDVLCGAVGTQSMLNAVGGPAPSAVEAA
jgi:hypothetical protein